tara:strand:- start:1184 stop:2167 length:984 start_codon:yes stop_codon:yes gene_type:complete
MVKLCHRPTPLEPLKRLSKILGGPEIWIKRDDCTGLSTGGNKTRKLEYLVGDALKNDADTLVTQGAVQSNHARQTAAAAAKIGLKCHILLERRIPDKLDEYERTGNVFLDKIHGATVEFRESGLDMNAEGEAVSNQLRENGAKPYFIPGGGSNAVGALGYVSCALELISQFDLNSIKFDCLIQATGSTGTQAGLVSGLCALSSELPVLGISVRQNCERQIDAVWKLVKETVEKLNTNDIKRDKILVDDNYIGKGYAIPTDGTLEAIDLLAKTEGILLDPVYSGKAMAGLIDMVRKGNFNHNEKILFLHTGGSAALFAYEQELRKFSK